MLQMLEPPWALEVYSSHRIILHKPGIEPNGGSMAEAAVQEAMEREVQVLRVEWVVLDAEAGST